MFSFAVRMNPFSFISAAYHEGQHLDTFKTGTLWMRLGRTALQYISSAYKGSQTFSRIEMVPSHIIRNLWRGGAFWMDNSNCCHGRLAIYSPLGVVSGDSFQCFFYTLGVAEGRHTKEAIQRVEKVSVVWGEVLQNGQSLGSFIFLASWLFAL